MPFDIETYLNSLPNDTHSIDLSLRGLKYLPDLSKFKNLQYLNCAHNNLTYLPPLKYLIELNCSYNNLTSLPPLRDKMILIFNYNPIYSLLYYNFKYYYMCELNMIIKKINIFRNIYYQLKFKKHFIKWLWKSRERYIAEKYHPKYLLENLDENTDLDEFLNNW